nr:unnamed protein product [Callosobruchus analis]
MGHYSTDITVARILEHYWFAGMRRYVRRHIAACIECLYVKIPAGKKPGYLHPIPVPNRPFSRIHMDHTGPYITTQNKTTGKTPFEVLYGFKPRFYDGILRKIVRSSEEEWTPPRRLQDEIRETIKQKQIKMKERYDKEVRKVPVTTGESTKLQVNYKGPLVISKVLPADTYEVTTLNPERAGHIFKTNVHVSQLKYCEESEESEEEQEDSENEGAMKTKRITRLPERLRH